MAIEKLDQDLSWQRPDFAWLAPAKINLFLHITGRRPDGYHNLQTVFQFLSYYDELFFKVRHDGMVHRINEIEGVPAEQDLTVRAAHLLQQQAKSSLGCDIIVNKHLPMGGGLGGGSSDAATTLIALNLLWKTSLSTDGLAKLGLQLGADVPIFIFGHAAWAEGVGEKVQAITLEEPWFVVLHPPVHVNTGKIFSHPELTRNQHPITIRDFSQGRTVNVCQPVVERLFPEIGEARSWLEKYGPARMTGTGSCVFAPFPSEDAARACASQAPTKWHPIVAQGLNETPLHRYFTS
jgi:4-diphosphocytidyl-2-C-methyl-D-erythritol kinase